jgi:hypothetical protein
MKIFIRVADVMVQIRVTHVRPNLSVIFKRKNIILIYIYIVHEKRKQLLGMLKSVKVHKDFKHNQLLLFYFIRWRYS